MSRTSTWRTMLLRSLSRRVALPRAVVAVLQDRGAPTIAVVVAVAVQDQAVVVAAGAQHRETS